MPRRPRIDQEGFHHVLNRGVARQDVFLDPSDFEFFLKLMEESALLHSCIVHSFCLMNNHYHLLIETKKSNLSLFMRTLNAGYAIYFNKKYHRVGHLWQGRYKSWYVADEGYLYTLVKYIELNPVKADIVTKAEQYPYGAIRSFFGLCEPRKCVKDSIIFQNFRSVEERRALFGSWYSEEELAAFRKSAMNAHSHESKVIDNSALLITIFADVGDKKKERNAAIIKAYEAGVPQHQIASFLKLTQPTIAYVVAKSENRGQKK